jgi:hypothetical protein
MVSDQVLTTRNEIERRVEDVLSWCSGKYIPILRGHEENSVFSQQIGFTYIQMVYVFLLLEDQFGILLSAIDWEQESMFTFFGLCDLVFNHMVKNGSLKSGAQ